MAGIQVSCPKCGKVLRLRDRSLLGRKGKCPSCEHRFVLQEPQDVELQLADTSTAAVGTGAKRVPDNAAAAPPTQAVASAEEIGGIGEIITEDPSIGGGSSRLKELKRKNAKRRNWGIVAGGLIALGIVGVLYVAQGYGHSKKENESGKKKPQVDKVYQAEKDELRSNVNLVAAYSPTKKDDAPIDLKYIPAGAGIVINLRPAELWQKDGLGEEFRYCLGPLAQWTEEQLREVCQFEPAEIEEVLLCLILGARGDPPEVAAVVHLVEPQKRSDLLKKFSGNQIDDYGYPVTIGETYAYLLVKDSKTIAIAPKAMAAEMVDAMLAGSPTATGIEEILPLTNRQRHITVVFQPVDARIHQDFLVPENAREFFNQFLDWFGDDVETVAWSIHLGKQFHSEILMRNQHIAGMTPTRLHKSLRNKLKLLPSQVLEAVSKMAPKETGKRQLIGRVPLMTKAFAVETVSGIGDRYVQLTTILPERAGPNLALGTLLAWDESTRTDFSKTVVAKTGGAKLPDSIEERLKQKIEIDFRRTPLYAAFDYIAEETKVKIVIDGDALKLSGYTKNMAQTFNLGNAPGIIAIHKIVKRYGEMVIIVDEKTKQVTVMTRAVAADRKLTPYKFK